MAEGKSSFVYVTYIRTTPEALWEALTTSDFMRKYWFGVTFDTDWKAGGAWKMVYPDGSVTDSGEVLAFDPPRRMVLKWKHENRPELACEGYALCTIEIEPHDGAMKLTICHEMERTGSKLIEAVSGGWPRILANLKSLLETGDVLWRTKAG